MIRKILLCFVGLAGACVIFLIVLFLAALLVSPDNDQEAVHYDPDYIEAVKQSRKTILDHEHPPVFYREVDYSEGASAQWFPKHQSPLLEQLQQQGLIEPLAQRVGPEPLVVEGIDGIGRYGGTWYRLTTGTDMKEMGDRLSYVTLVRWSAQGYPIVPHLAKSYHISKDNYEFTFHLRKGIKWSDGHPFTADDILFWWEHIANDTSIMANVPDIMKIRGQPGSIEKIDDYTIQFRFPYPNGIFLSKLASDGNIDSMLNCPKHYLSKYHPTMGDQELIDKTIKAKRMPSKTALFRDMLLNILEYPDMPRLWPWIYRKYKAVPPQSFVRNPYFWMVDTQGNQLPYIDRIVFQQKSPDMIPIAAANGEVTMQMRFIPYEEYTHFMKQQQLGGYHVYHWYPGDRSTFVIAPNINYKVDPNDPVTVYKHELLNDKRFRQALSLAINRKKIIAAEFSGQAEPAQCAPGPSSFFYHEQLYHAFTAYDPHKSCDLLNEIGLRKRDNEGYRTFPDGNKMTFYLNIASGFSSPGAAQLVCDDWSAVGLRVILKIRNRGLFYTEKIALKHDLDVWVGNSEYLPVIEPRYFVPMIPACNFAVGYAKWYMNGGLYSNPEASLPGCIEPPLNHPCRQVMTLYDRACQYNDRSQLRAIFNEIFDINRENLWTINLSTPPPVIVIVKEGLKNVPHTAVASWMFRTPGNAGMETYYLENQHHHPSVIKEIKDSMLHVQMPDRIQGLAESDKAIVKSQSGKWVKRIIQFMFWLILFVMALCVLIRHPYIARRLLIMIPTLLVISIIIFFIIQLPPGDYLTTRIMMLAEQGDTTSIKEAQDLKTMFWLDEPIYKRYLQWMGFYWFISFDDVDTGLLQGNLGRSMQAGTPVNDIVGDRILLTLFISLGTILFTWLVAIPVGIYSAVRQYSLTDYILTFLGFIGMCIPSFLLALICMYLGKQYLGITFSGLFSSRFGAQPEWDVAKFMDLLRHIWLPIIVIGVGGTAGMIRVMRGNLLDELRKPYVVTARAKGLRPIKLLFKYPVRLALNPFISGVGTLFPKLISGGAIVAMVLSLPTVGPLMLDALLMEDMYLAGSMLMVLSLLGVTGTLVSDVLLLWLDPRIRFTGEKR